MPKADNYVLGRGRLYFAPFLPNTQTPSHFRYIGNTTELNISISSDVLAHYSSETGVREKNDSVTTQTDRTGSFVTDNIDADNLALFFFGSVGAVAQAAGSATLEQVGPASGVVKGGFYQLGASPANPTGVRNISAVTITGNGGTPTYVAGTDYVVDLATGMVEILTAGAIPNNTPLRGNYTRTLGTRAQVLSGSVSIEGALKFIADNPKGTNRDIFAPWTRITANGDFAIKAESDWQNLPFNIDIMTPSSGAALYIDDRQV
jgi:hypothetical protein